MSTEATDIRPTRTRYEGLALLSLVAGAMGIAFAPIFVKLSPVPPVATGVWRLAFALPVFWIWMALDVSRNKDSIRKAWPDTRMEAIGLAAAGMFFACDLGVWHWSLQFTTVANSTLLSNLAPVFVTLAGWLLFRERVTGLFMAGLALAIAGATVLVSGSVRLSAENAFGDILGVVTAMFYAGYIVAVARLRASFSTVAIMSWSSLTGFFILLAVAILTGENLMADSISGWSILLGLALISHVLGQSLIAYALAHLPASFSSVGLLLQPAGAAVLAWVLLDEPLGLTQAFAALIIIGGIILARMGRRKSA